MNACFFLSAVCAASLQAADFNSGWQWRLEKEDAWRNVDLPHDFMFEGPWSEKAEHSQCVFKPTGAAVYRKTFDWDPAWEGRRVLLDFGGVTFFGDVWVNGRHVAATEYGWLGFETDVTDALLKKEANVVEVRAEVKGGSAHCRWYTGGGLCRGVTVKTVGAQRIARHGVIVTTRENRFADVAVEVEGFVGWTNETDIVAEISGFGFSRTLVAKVEKGNNLRRQTVRFPSVEVPAARTWSPETPDLYRLAVRLGGQTETVRFGFRTISFDKDHGFRLNGRQVFLRGMASHADWGALGAAVYPDAIRRQFRRMKEFGYNAVRCSHNPYPVEFYDLADEMGLLVVDELTDKWNGNWAGRKPFLEIWPALLTEWVRRDRNHPSVILWSLGNETQHEERLAGYPTDDWGVTTYLMMDVLVRRWDVTRPTTVAMYPSRAGGIYVKDPRFRQDPWIRAPELARETEVTSLNYRCDEYQAYLAKDPEMVIFQSEAAVRRDLAPYFLMDRDKMVGLCYWGAIEYWGESNAWPKKGWNFSFFSHALRPYPTAYQIQSGFFRDRPLVRLGVRENSETVFWNDIHCGTTRLTENWNRTSGAKNDIVVYSNAPEVELFLNGRSLGCRAVPLPPAGNAPAVPPAEGAWHAAEFKDVTWEPGELKAVAANGATHAIRTTGPAERLHLAVEPGTETLKYVWIEAVDAAGAVVPTVRDRIAVSVTGDGRLLALDDDDHYTNLPFDVPAKRMKNGRLLAIVRLKSPVAQATLVVRSPLSPNGESLPLK